MQPTIEVRAERLLAALAGVVSARVVADELGRLSEIHILASPDLHPKQIVRNVESALTAGLGAIVDRRVISVAQLRQNAAEPYMARRKQLALEAEQKDGRLVYVQYDAESTSSLDTRCYVTLRRGSEQISGSSSGVNTVQGRADAAARAVFDALQQHGDTVGLEGASIVEMHGKSFVLVSARAVSGRSARVLTGVAALQRSPEEAAILAALQATNRLASL
jgi:hypothetical protein